MSTSPAPQRRNRRRLRRALPITASLALLATVGLIASPAAQAVHDAGAMQLDGNAQTSVQSNPVAADDWDRICFDVTGDAAVCGTGTGSGATAAAWSSDGSGSASIFTGGGSKDPIDLSSWKWKNGGGLPDKDNLTHAFAARYSLPNSSTCPAGSATSCELLFFGSDRFDNSGDAVQGFWFFQNRVTLNADGTFNGTHRVGDVLVLSDFSNGGTTSTINVYKWVGSGGDTNGTLDFLAGGTTALCGGSTADAFCGIVNGANGTPAPWAFTDKSGNDSYLQGEFFEGGINLSDPSINLADTCFSSVASESRSSTSPTATLKDFVLGDFGDCTSTTVTTPKQDDGTTSIPSTGVSLGSDGTVSVRDSATVTANGAGSVSPGGSVSFWLCGPTPLSDANYTLCGTGGTAIGTAKALDGSNPDTVVSDAAVVSSAGRYCWRAEYTGDATKGIPGSTDATVTECFKVLPVTPTLSTQAGAGPVTLGNPVTDTATLNGTIRQPGSPVINPTTQGALAGGTITFKLYGPGSANCNTLATGFPSAGISRAVSGNGTYPAAGQDAVSFTPTAVGTYYWKATYSGSSPNTLGVTHNADCADTNEQVVVQQLNPSMTTAQSFVPNDSATVTVASGGGDLAGSVVFKLYDNQTCTGSPLYESSPISIATGTGTGLSRTVLSNNTTAYTSDKTFSWLVTYTSTNPGHTGVTKICDDEHSSITINNDYLP